MRWRWHRPSETAHQYTIPAGLGRSRGARSINSRQSGPLDWRLRRLSRFIPCSTFGKSWQLVWARSSNSIRFQRAPPLMIWMQAMSAVTRPWNQPLLQAPCQIVQDQFSWKTMPTLLERLPLAEQDEPPCSSRTQDRFYGVCGRRSSKTRDESRWFLTMSAGRPVARRSRHHWMSGPEYYSWSHGE